GSLEISVTDTGRGIPEEMLEHVFDLFTQGPKGATDGLGIGLTLVRTIAELHGGSVSVASGGEDRGSTFTLRLPVLVNEAQAHEDKRSHGKARCRALVVDDAKATADTLALFLELEGLETAVAYNGEQAVE